MGNLHLILGASLPTLGKVTNYIQTEGGNAATIVLVIMAIFFLVRQKIGAFIGFLIFAGAVFFIIGDPGALIDGIKAFWEMLV
ncbi:hypothetical protein HB885_11775 [Listeria seeligeri]|uniref:TcpD family membrane protein n=1 Tax=Listeria seeligeri TaxID=1640 RepID=UPI0016256DB7|nr:TcpD family membrane protein [Listeria seeligeri]HBJ9162209.1 hypothetical protein [Listeria monocytogenes]MBC1534011.1 hypothetical protein [Listeria seeligeri]MBC1581569.1 hypothetical protein [Listeria seeligeri]MBC1880807.1 hypothetical protein [Listeria seeligeri]MBF2543367.1 hypothetical protein [Listeria seeligeri]